MSVENFKMFRYLSKNYCGKYRVRTHAIDLELEDFPRDENGVIASEIDDEYIECSRGGEIRATYHTTRGKDILCWYTDSLGQGNNVYKELKAACPGVELTVTEASSYDYIIEFDAADFDKIAKVLKPRTNGAKIRPLSNKNLPKVPYVIPEKDEQLYSEIVKDMERADKMIFCKKICEEFDKVIQKKKGASYDITAERRKSKLKPKQFIHSIGMWKEFIELATERYKEYYNEN